MREGGTRGGKDGVGGNVCNAGRQLLLYPYQKKDELNIHIEIIRLTYN